LLERIDQGKSLDEDTRTLAQDKIKAVAEGLSKIQEFRTLGPFAQGATK